MSETQNDVVISSRVRLARNYHDLPFSNLKNPANAQICIDRAREAYSEERPGDRYRFYMLRMLPKLDQLSLLEEHLISKDLLATSDIGAALIRKDKCLSLMINEEDHLRIQAMLPGLALTDAEQIAFEAEEKLQRKCDFSFDSQLGYLTACPTNTGTGMRASLMLHLPLLTASKQMGSIGQSIAKLGLTIRGIYGEGSEALGDVYQVSNQVTLGRTEDEIVEAVLAVGKQLIDLENTLRERAARESLSLADQISRSYGVLRYAMLMNGGEFMEHWSNLRLGAALRLLPVSLETADELLSVAQEAHVKKYKHAVGKQDSTEAARCEIIKQKLIVPPQEV